MNKTDFGPLFYCQRHASQAAELYSFLWLFGEIPTYLIHPILANSKTSMTSKFIIYQISLDDAFMYFLLERRCCVCPNILLIRFISCTISTRAEVQEDAMVNVASHNLRFHSRATFSSSPKRSSDDFYGCLGFTFILAKRGAPW